MRIMQNLSDNIYMGTKTPHNDTSKENIFFKNKL
jgi:hypothetical protein